jgi:hypothetical protein
MITKNFGFTAQGRIKIAVHDARSKKKIRESGWENNLFLDYGMVNINSFAQNMNFCKVGGGTNPNSYASGGVQFTQSGNTVVCATGGNFFTSAMVGGILKYGFTGTAGAEQYITAVTGSPTGGLYPSCTVSGPGMTMGVTVGTVWMVQQTALQTWLQTSTGVQAGADPVFSGGNATLTRVCVFPIPSTSITVNEVAYSQNANADGTCNGRITLGTSWVVTTAQFLVVTVQIVYAYSPNSPQPVTGLGTGINVDGQVMVNTWDIEVVNAAGANVPQIRGSGPFLDSGAGTRGYIVFDHTVNNTGLSASIGTAPYIPGAAGYQSSPQMTWTNIPPNSAPYYDGVSRFVANPAYSFTTAGETLYSIFLGSFNSVYSEPNLSFILLLTTPYVLPVGTFAGTVSLVRTISRVLSN